MHASLRSLLPVLTLCACTAPRGVELAGTTRLVATPTSISALSQDQSGAELPAQVTFGGSHGRSALYLKFPTDFRAHGEPLKAFIALSARADSPVNATPVTVEAWRIASAWKPEDLAAWSDKPPLAPPYARATFTSSPARDLRIDVTELVRFALANPTQNFGIALLSHGGSGHGASFATGMSAGAAPRLEIYAR